MALRIQVPRKAFWSRIFLSRFGRICVGFFAVVSLLGLIAFTYFYLHYAQLIDAKLRAGPLQSTSMVFATPRLVSIGDEIQPSEIVNQLRRSGYQETQGNRMGWYHLRSGVVEIFPGADSYFDDEPGVIKFEGGRVSQIISLRDNTPRMQYALEPELITNLSDRNREKRRIVEFADIPKLMVQAVVSAEDKRFFYHAGFDPLRIIKAAYVDVKEGYRAQGGSTLSQQLARMFWLDNRKTWGRKGAEVLVTLHLEQKLSKEEIFQYYFNQVPLGRRGSFSIHGFGEASRAYLGKDLKDLSLPDAALLAGLVQRPSVTNPFLHPDRAVTRRNLVLGMMRDNGYITEQQYRDAVASPLRVARGELESADAPYFVDLVNDELQSEFGEHDFKSDTFRVYTTLDMNLQRAAAEAVRIGMQEVDQRLSARRRRAGGNLPEAQVALVALDPETGAVKALIGGRNYGLSQLNRALAKRQPGSSFKPFVYAAALNTAVTGSPQPFTPATRLLDEPTTFWFDEKPYSPANFKSEYHGEVSLREALAHSMNIPTVKLAQAVGYGAVEDLAKRAGMNLNIRPTPAIALGAYEVMPLEISGAYTVFATQGNYVKPNWIALIRDREGKVLFNHQLTRVPVLDPRVAYLMQNLMEEVLRSGTGATVRGRGFTLPAAGKTGTSHDGWFAGFTSKLICVVWVGFDDNRELNLEGAHSALPVWTEFMKRAHQYREYRNVREFSAPDGVVSVEIDPATGQLATAACPSVRTEVFIAGTQPVDSCRLHGGAGATRVASWEAAPAATGSAAATPPRSTASPSDATAQVRLPAPPPAAAKPPAEAAKPKEEQKKGFFRRLLGVFK